MLENRGNGYNGYSMSNNAVNAYENGEMPYSKWTKTEIIDAAVKKFELSDDEIKTLKSYKAAVLKEGLLVKTSWHHTSEYYNRTDFYSLGEGINFDFLNEIAEEMKAKKKEKEYKKAYIKYVEWAGSRRHPKAIDKESNCIIDDKWAYLPDGSKKKLSGRYVDVVKTFDRAPKGTAAEFKKIEKRLK